MHKRLALGVLVGLAATAANADLLNADIETNDSDLFGPINFWGPNGGWADHAGFAKPGNESLGEAFGFYSVNNEETVGQMTDVVFQNGVELTFGGYGQGGGNDVGTVIYEIGYDDGAGEFVLLASASYEVGESWELLDGVSYTPSDGDGAAGNNVWVRLGAGDVGVPPEDVWFDSFYLVPAPGTAALLGLGLLAGTRRRR